MIKDWIAEYQPKTDKDYQQALREIMQQIALAGLYLSLIHIQMCIRDRYKTSGGKMVYNETLKREIPEGWEVKTIGDYCKSTGGFAFKSSWWTDNGCLLYTSRCV